MYIEQLGQCAICRCDISTGKDCHIDHCHDTDIVRGLLCNKCNNGLGMFNHNKDILVYVSL